MYSEAETQSLKGKKKRVRERRKVGKTEGLAMVRGWWQRLGYIRLAHALFVQILIQSLREKKSPGYWQ